MFDLKGTPPHPPINSQRGPIKYDLGICLSIYPDGFFVQLNVGFPHHEVFSRFWHDVRNPH